MPEGHIALGQSDEFFEGSLEFAATLGPQFEEAVRAVRENPAMFPLFVVDPHSGPSGLITTVNVVREETTLTAEEYMRGAVGQFPPDLGRAVSQEMVSLERYQAGRIILDLLDAAGVAAGREVVYLVRAGNAVYTITFFTGIDEFEARLPTFEQSIRTFTVREE